MHNTVVEKKFNSIGARVKLVNRPVNGDVFIDVQKDKSGEFFDIISNGEEIDLQVLDVDKSDRHILLMAKGKKDKKKFLCGFDERHFFSCAIPETAGVSTILQAKQALKPNNILEVERGIVKSKNLHKRHKKIKTGKMHRQGEFFFTPIPNYIPSKNTIIRQKEPMRRGAGKPHTAEFLIRTGGEQVYVCSKYRNGITELEYRKLIKENIELKKLDWSIMALNATAIVKGKITHSDHKTLDLGHVWHTVSLNTEDKAKASRNVRFLD